MKIFSGLGPQITTLTFLLTLIASAQEAPQIKVLNANRVMRRNQGVLNWHILNKTQNNATTELTTLDLCFLSVQENNTSSLEVYIQRCPANNLQEFRTSAKRLNRMELSPLLKSTASAEFEKLKSDYAPYVAQVATDDMQKAGALAANDSLGQLVFMELNGKKVNVGYIDNTNRIMELCSGAWNNLCYFYYRSVRPEEVPGFRLGYEVVERLYDGDPRADWLYPRTYYDMTDVLAGTTYTRGNDDSRDQALYLLTIPSTGKKVPISEDWYTYFFVNPKTRNLVEVAKDSNAKVLKSHRTRSEWNYLTAIHPIHLVKVKESGTGIEKTQLHMGASVIYSESLEIEDADCEMAETEGFELVNIKSIALRKALREGGIFSEFERKMLFREAGDTDNEDERRLGMLSKTEDAYFVPRKWQGEEIEEDLSQQKYIPALEGMDKLKLFGMTTEIPVGSAATLNLSILKSMLGISNLLIEEEEGFADDGQTFIELASMFNMNQVKEFLSLEKLEDGKMKITLEGFNPNEMMANNPSIYKFPRSEFETHYDPEAVLRVWSLDSNSQGPTHTASREVAEALRKLKIALNSNRYKSLLAPGQTVRKDVPTLIAELDAGRSLLEEERDWYVGQLDKSYRMAGKNVGFAYGVKGNGDYLRDLYMSTNRSIQKEMTEPDWKFPNHYLSSNYNEDTNDTTLGVITLEDEDLEVLKKFIKNKEKNSSIGKVLVQDRIDTTNALLNDPHFLQNKTNELLGLATLSTAFEQISSNETYFIHFYDYNDSLKRTQAATAAQKQSIDTSLGEVAEFGVLKAYADYNTQGIYKNFNRAKLFKETNDCYLAAEADTAKLQACKDKYSNISGQLMELCERIGLPQFWELE